MSTRGKATQTRKRLTADDRRATIERAATEVFAERGYRGASIDEIARRSGITPPVLYDHFGSKQELYERLVEKYYAELREIWFSFAATDEPMDRWMPDAIEAWFAYIESNRFAARMLFRDTTGDPAIAKRHRKIQDRSRSSLLPLVAAADIESLDVPDNAELAWETLRAVMQGLALWWYEHPKVTRGQVVRAAMNAIWIGFERVLQGEEWTPYTTD